MAIARVTLLEASNDAVELDLAATPKDTLIRDNSRRTAATDMILTEGRKIRGSRLKGQHETQIHRKSFAGNAWQQAPTTTIWAVEDDLSDENGCTGRAGIERRIEGSLVLTPGQTLGRAKSCPLPA